MAAPTKPDSQPPAAPSASANLVQKIAGPLTSKVSPRRKKLALVIAGLADAIQLIFWPLFGGGAPEPSEDALDAVIAIVLLFILGFNWRLGAAFLAELVPGLDLFPTWSAVVLSIPAESAQPVTPALPPGS